MEQSDSRKQSILDILKVEKYVYVSGLSERFGVSPVMLEREIKRCMVDISTGSYVLTGHGKFGNVTLSVIAPVNSVFCIITDGKVPASRLLEIQERGVRVMPAKV